MTADFPDNPWENPPHLNPWTELRADTPAAMPVLSLGRLNAVDFMSAMRQNRRNTIYLITGMLVLTGAFGYVIGWLCDNALGGAIRTTMDGRIDWGRAVLTPSPLGITIGAALLAGMLAWVFVALWRADKMVLRMTDAQDTDARSLPQLHNIVEEIALAAGVPKPRVVLVHSDTPNAFATGLRTDRAVIGVTSGLLQHLNRRELQGVIAHEMGHIVNGDMRYATLLAVMTGVLVFVAQILLGIRHMVGYATLSRGQHDERRQGGGHPLLVVFALVFAVIAAIVVPLLARLIQMAVSRQREYLADATAVQLTRDPQSMIGALEKISALQSPSKNLPQGLEPLYIMTPVKMLQNGNMAWFSTHPPLQKRIERLKSLE